MLGLLGQFGMNEQTVPGILGNLHSGIASNRNSLIGAGMGMMSPGGQGMQTAMKGWMAGADEDRRRQQYETALKMKEQERQQQIAQARALGLDPAFAGNDAIIGKAWSDKYGRREPKAESLFDRFSPEQRESYLDKMSGRGGDKDEWQPFNYKAGAIEATLLKNKKGDIRMIDGSPFDPSKLKSGTAGTNPYSTGKMNEVEGKSATFADRAFESNKVIQQLDGLDAGLTAKNEFVKPPVGADRSDRIAAAIPFDLGKGQISRKGQMNNQAQLNFVTAVLRKESGAVIGDEEFEREAKKYFPQPGESPPVVAQKRLARQTAIEGLMREAGQNYVPPAGAVPGSGAAGQSPTDPLAGITIRQIR